jgi:hypothetical protein
MHSQTHIRHFEGSGVTNPNAETSVSRRIRFIVISGSTEQLFFSSLTDFAGCTASVFQLAKGHQLFELNF